MQRGQDHLRRRDAFLSVDVHRNPATVVLHRDRLTRVNDDVNLVAVSGQRLINAVVDELLDHMMETGAILRIADVHPWSLADRVEPSQHLNAVRIVLRLRTSQTLCANRVTRALFHVEQLSLRPCERKAQRHVAGSRREDLAVQSPRALGRTARCGPHPTPRQCRRSGTGFVAQPIVARQRSLRQSKRTRDDLRLTSRQRCSPPAPSPIITRRSARWGP